jgi:hypothetical protein
MHKNRAVLALRSAHLLLSNLCDGDACAVIFGAAATARGDGLDGRVGVADCGPPLIQAVCSAVIGIKQKRATKTDGERAASKLWITSETPKSMNAAHAQQSCAATTTTTGRTYVADACALQRHHRIAFQHIFIVLLCN